MNHQNISVQSENYRKLLMTLSEDFRVILIKIADRLHNMRTLDSMRADKQKKIASKQCISMLRWHIDWGCIT